MIKPISTVQPKGPAPSRAAASFNEMGFAAPVNKAILNLGFENPTPIQSGAIPVVLAGRDLIGCARTGTGKTAAYCLPILTHLLKTPTKTVLVLAPTRELALQIEEFWRELTRSLPDMRSIALIGGASMGIQIRALARKPRFLVATPGRLVDHLRRGTAKLADVGFLVLDEADRMLDMGFAPQLAQIQRAVPKQRQTLFFTATWDGSLDKLASNYLRDPERVTIGTASMAAPEVRQTLVSTTPQGKNDALLDEINKRQGSLLVFTRTKSRTDRVTRYLSEFGVSVGRIHGGRTQAQRSAALAALKSGQIRVLVATDIAARGLDIAEISHVVNYDLPQVADDYIHRIGRTGRAGATGEAVSLVSHEDRRNWQDISRLLKKTGSQVPESEELARDSKGQSQASPSVKDANDRNARHRARPNPRQFRRPSQKRDKRFASHGKH